MAHPDWFSNIQWSNTVPIEVLRINRNLIPSMSGVYCFTNYPTTLEKNLGVLYVGKAKTLRTRLPAYIKDPAKINIQSTRSERSPWNTSLNHAGAALMLMDVQAKYRPEGRGATVIWVRWYCCNDPDPLELQLIEYLQPKYCSIGVER